ncbi:helix-turn-helix transcriptional regulator [Pedococcus bigeumensis]|nr:helix-turn-helix domain-containing protein [Pedococcus bigeumensis]
MSAAEGEHGRGIALPRDWSSMRELRQARGMSQTRLAQLSGVSERTVRAIEGGAVSRPQHESLSRIAAVLAHGASHQTRLVERWTGSSTERTHDDLGVPDWEVIARRIGRRRPGDGGRITSALLDITTGPDRVPLECRYTHIHEAMGASGSPVLWKLVGSAPFDASSVRFEVRTGGVLDDFFVHGDVVGVAIRPDPAMAQRGPFVLEYSVDFRGAERLGGAVDDECMYGANTPLQTASVVVRFTGERPARIWPVQGATAATAERGAPLSVAADGSAQLCLQDFVGVFGVKWQWGDETS